MAVPSYTTDLINIDLCEAGGKTWAEPTASSWLAGAAPTSDDDNPFQGSLAMSKAFNAIGIGGMMVDNGASVGIPTDGAFTGWHFWAPPAALESDANGGIRFMCGSDLANFLSWDVGGAQSYAYGGWVNYAVNTTVSADDIVGTGLGNSRYFGAAVNCINSIFKGSPFLCDAFRYGRCEARMSGGSSTDGYATFDGYAASNDAVATRWGLIQAIAGGYLVKGLVIFGYGSAVDFQDSNKNLFIQNTTKVTTNFNGFEVRQVTSHISWTGINITALGITSKGRFLTTDNADVDITNCTFTDMNTFAFMSGATILNTIFRRCGQVTQGGAIFTNCKFDNSTASIAFVVDTIANVTNTEFISDGTGFAFEGCSTAGSYSLSGLNFNGYASVDGTTGNEAIHVLAASGDVAFAISGGNTPSIYTEGASVTFPSSRLLKMVVKNATGGVMDGVQVYIDDNNLPDYILNTVTASNGEASILYTGDNATNATWRARKYGYKPFEQLVSIGSEAITLPVTMIVDSIVL